MHKFMKPMILAGLLAGAASASPMWASHEDPAVLREDLRTHQMAYNTAVSNRNFDRARFEKDQIDIAQSKLDMAEVAVRWDLENSEDYHLMVTPDSDNYYLRRTTVVTTPGVVTLPGTTRVFDPITETYHYIRVTP